MSKDILDIIGMPNNVQHFDDVPVDLNEFEGVYNRYLGIMESEARTKSYAELDMKEAINATLNNPVYQNSFEEAEKDEMLKDISSEYQVAAKEILRQEYPVIDQLVLDGKIKEREV